MIIFELNTSFIFFNFADVLIYKKRKIFFRMKINFYINLNKIPIKKNFKF